MRDPTRRDHPDSWPRDRPVRWGALGRNVSGFFARTAIFVIQFALIVPVIAMVPGSAWGGWLQTLVGVVWGIGTLWAGWCWMLGDLRGVAAPIATTATLLVAAGVGSAA